MSNTDEIYDSVNSQSVQILHDYTIRVHLNGKRVYGGFVGSNVGYYIKDDEHGNIDIITYYVETDKNNNMSQVPTSSNNEYDDEQ